jgi:hypothetical protein
MRIAAYILRRTAKSDIARHGDCCGFPPVDPHLASFQEARVMAKKTNVKKSRSLNATDSQPAAGAPANQQDVKRRLGNFGGAGEHPRQGGRTSGIVGQKKSQNRTDKGGKK